MEGEEEGEGRGALAGEGEGEGEACPVCHDLLGQELVMLPCGHKLCCRCHISMTEQIPTFQPAASKRIGCPTCRARILLTEIAYVVAQPQDKNGIVEMMVDTETPGTVAAGAGGNTSNSNSAAAAAVWSDEASVRVQVRTVRNLKL